MNTETPAAPRRMRVLLVTQNFAPEMGALSVRLGVIARELAASGHEVHVATGMPNYPLGRVFPAYRGRLAMSEVVDGVLVHRTRSYTTARNRSAVKQLLAYLAFVPAVFLSGRRAGAVDVVLVTSPPLFPALAALALRRLRRARLVVDVRDLWPDEIVGVGAAAPDSAIVRLLSRIERAAYRRADLVTCASASFVEVIRARGARADRVVHQPNGADLDLFRPLPPDNPIAREYPFGDRVVVTYSGLMGVKHDLQTTVGAAEALRERSDIVFFLRGDGPARPAVEARVRDAGLSNVLLGEERPMADLPHLIARSDICVANLVPTPEMRRIVSVKLYEYMAAGRPIVAGVAGEAARIIEESGAGLVVPPGDPEAMASAIAELADDPGRRDAMGAAGLAYVSRNHSRVAWARRLEERLLAITAPSAAHEDPVIP